MALLSPTSTAHAATPPLRGLALPRSDFPRHATVQGGTATDYQAYAATGLHTVALSALGRSGGYLQIAHWRLGKHPFELRYSASLFASTAAASAARADALASAWELGQPRTVGGIQAFEIDERDGQVDLVALGRQGPVTIEVVLRLARGAPTRPAFWYFQHVVHRASRVASRFAASLPPTPAQPSSETPPYVAPLGTGPVVKSPSLMALDSSVSGVIPDPGAFRSHPPPLARRAMRHPALVPPAPLARYVRTALSGDRPIYSSTVLYPDEASASSAFQRLAVANFRKDWLRPFQPPSPNLPNTQIGGWHGRGEAIVALRTQNVLLVLAGTSGGDLAPLAGDLLATVPTWLHAQGTQLVDAAGKPVRLIAINWYGAESPDFVVGGLDYRPYQDILATIQQAGYNTIRLPFSNQLVEANPVVTQHLAANPELAGLHALDILDRIIGYAGALGLSVILDNHRSEAGWSAEQNGLWYTAGYPDSSFVADWSTVARRYAGSNAVIAADLRNEPHAGATWASGDPTTDWLAAAERAGDAALAANPHLLIMVEGVQRYGTDSYWWGGNLLGVATNPAILHLADGSSARSQLVYSVHDYGPNTCGTGCPWFNDTTSYDSLAQLWEEHWGYITANPATPYAAPVFVGEFGTCNTGPSCGSDPTPGSQGQWFSSLVQYIAQKNLSWAYWPVNGTQSSDPARSYGAPEGYGYLAPDWTTSYSWLASQLKSLQTES